jgi:L-ascorbate metabolism protein UlaG (beta-lactamase superfamily)
MSHSPHYLDGAFVDDEPAEMLKSGGTSHWLKETLFGKEMVEPICPLPTVDPSAVLQNPPTSGLRVTWLGHSTTIIEIDGVTFLTDPNWGERASPTTIAGPKRFHPPPLAFEKLPHIDAVLISHDHYDHLDMGTIKALAASGVPFHVGLGVGAHLKRWGVPASQIFEHDWWDEIQFPKGVRLFSTPARHFSGRGVFTRNPTLWTSWSLIGPKHRAFFSGDTGMTKGFSEIAQRFAPFDVAMIEIGQWDATWGDIHLGPSGALDASLLVGAQRLVPIHWGTFALALHAWSQPAEVAYVEAPTKHVKLLTPRLGEPVEPTDDPPTTPWWRALPPTVPACPQTK